ncbi:regulatory GntR family protein [Kribbella sp. VKM Ac-2571]|uniref:GntR family transcriptional regulator n=1 Tax=Kribbella sp. VKM Ac-2571 TaxID=2512222 RepID=UPI00105E748C|nr:winged helix-turn-helix domain-containing protein [Kribbella sp. VKM Ac-2571]TDO62584.1 regulatory GntR family protein [Kribbella sp. VKM Ac-2571]
MELDPNDTRPPYRQVATALRAGILTQKFTAGERLPSQQELATQYGVARMTIQQALKVLRDEGLIVSRVGSGVYVRDRADQAVGLRPHIEKAFERTRVTIDFAGLTGETLLGALEEPIERIRRGRLTPESVTVRLLLPDLSQPLAVPSRAGSKPGDDPAVRDRVAEIAHRSAGAIAESVRELGELGLVQKTEVETRVIPLSMMFKMYLINDEELFFGFYPVVEREVKIGNKDVSIFDAVGKDTVLFHHSVSDGDRATGSQYVEQARRWFDSLWGTLGRTYEP